MKVTIGPYKNYYGPFQLAQYILFWKNPYGESVQNLGETIGKIPGVYKLTTIINNLKCFSERKTSVRIDNSDVFSLDTTLAYIIVPALKKLKESKQSAPYVDDEDCPEHLRGHLSTENRNDGNTDEHHFNRWDWVLDEMIWTFEQHSIDWEDQFFTGSMCETYCDKEGMTAHSKRMERGRMLFAKYYESLWS